MTETAMQSYGITNRMIAVLDYLEHGPAVADLADLNLHDVHRSCLAFERLARASVHTFEAKREQQS